MVPFVQADVWWFVVVIVSAVGWRKVVADFGEFGLFCLRFTGSW